MWNEEFNPEDIAASIRDASEIIRQFVVKDGPAARPPQTVVWASPNQFEFLRYHGVIDEDGRSPYATVKIIPTIDTKKPGLDEPGCENHVDRTT